MGREEMEVMSRSKGWRSVSPSEPDRESTVSMKAINAASDLSVALQEMEVTEALLEDVNEELSVAGFQLVRAHEE